MALSPQLLNFKSSGVYRLEFDKSQTSNIDIETLRLVVGSSRKGPYNTPVLIDSQEAFNNVFGSIDKGLEKKGMFFHRSCLEALSRGPILALNLGTFTPAVDTASSYSISTNGSEEGVLAVTADYDYDSYFDNDKFMTPSDTEVLKTVTNDDNHLLNFVNIKQDSITVIVRQAQDVAEFNLTAEEWYGTGNVPDYLNKSDRMSDFMMDVFVFKGEFDASEMANDPIYSEYFTAEGLDKTKLNSFANLRQVTLLAQYTGSILPGFKDLEGRNLYIESIVNAEARRTGLFCAVDEDAVLDEAGTKVDFVGHTVDADEDFELLSHHVGQNVTNGTLLSVENNHPTQTPGDITVSTSTTAPFEVVITDVEDNGTTLNSLVGEFLDAAASGEYAEVTANTAWTETLAATPTTYNNGAATGTAGFINVDNLGVSQTNPSTGVWEVTLTPDAGSAITNLTSLPLNKYVYGGTSQARAKLTLVSNTSPVIDEVVTLTFDAEVDSTILADFGAGNTFDYFDTDGVTLGEPALGEITITFDSLVNTSYDNATITTATTTQFLNVSNSRVTPFEFGVDDAGTYAAGIAGSTSFTVTYTTAPTSFPIVIGDYVTSNTVNRIARVERITKATVGTDTVYTVYTGIEPAYDNQIIKSFENASGYYKTFVLPKADITLKSISQYLSALEAGKGLYDALIDKDIIDFRYVVDTFTSYSSEGNIDTKVNLSKLAKDRQNASAILNAPTVEDFKLSTDPSFKNSEGIFDTRYVTTSGNQDLNPTKQYVLPSIAEGANYAFYYAPGLVVSDNGKDIIVPPAAYVSNNYIDKYTAALPWSIVAGPRRGVVAGTNVRGVEYAFDKNDRDNLEPFGINPIAFQRGVGLTILGNKTAQQSIKSALSSAHVREAMIYIQDGIANILKDYVFEFNNTQTRLEIKTLADSFMESVLADGGVYAYKNVMDSTNNTNEVIDNNIGIIDTFVEPVKGLEIVVHRTTILNTGEIQSGNLG